MICPNCGASIDDDSIFCNACGLPCKTRQALPAGSITTPAVTVDSSISPEALEKRIAIFVEDSEWDKAQAYCERLLDLEPENGNAYLFSLLIENRVCDLSALENLGQPLDDNGNYRKALRFGTGEPFEKLKRVNEQIKEADRQRREKELAENRENAYQRALNLLQTATVYEQFEEAEKLFQSLTDYRDSTENANLCHSKAVEYKEKWIESVYQNGKTAMEQASTEQEYTAAYDSFLRCGNYKDAQALALECRRLAAEHAENEKSRAFKKKRLTLSLVGGGLVLLAALFLLYSLFLNPLLKYRQAVELFEAEKYAEAKALFCSVENFKNSKDWISACNDRIYGEALSLIEAGSWTDAMGKLELIPEHNSSGMLKDYCRYQDALSHIDLSLRSLDKSSAYRTLNSVPDCAESAILWRRLLEISGFDADAAENASIGEFFMIDDILTRKDSELLSEKDYYRFPLEGDTSLVGKGIRCFDIDPADKSKAGSHLVIGAYYDADAGFFYSFKKSQILSVTDDIETYAGKLESEKTLAEVCGVTELLRAIETPKDIDPSAEAASPAPTPSQNQTPFPENSNGAAVFEVSYFSVELPDEWKDTITVDVDEVGNSMWFDMQADVDSYYTSYLFGLQLCSERQLPALDQTHPMHDVLGILTTDRGEEFYMIATFPNPGSIYFDDPSVRDQFGELQTEAVPKILETIRGINGCTYEPGKGEKAPTPVGQTAPDSRQAIVIGVSEYNGQYYSSLSLEEWNGSDWETVYYDIPAAIGSNGTTSNKREGDHCTPSGTFNILFCFSDQALETNLRQKYITEGDVWVTDQSSRYYNTIQPDSAGYKDWSKSENIYRQFTSGRSYAGILFDYNGDGESADSATPGAGAALFLDGIGSGGDLYTGYGDIKISESDMKRLLKVLDQSLNPTIIIRDAD